VVVEVKVASLQLLSLFFHPLDGGSGLGQEHARRVIKAHTLLVPVVKA
jgi:hypothetical protein